jgi:hypothetical protein
VKGEIHQEFTQIKQKLLLVKKWEDDALQLHKRNDFLVSYLQRLNQKHNKLSISTHGQLLKIIQQFQNNDKMKEQICFERLHQIENEVNEDAKIAT